MSDEKKKVEKNTQSEMERSTVNQSQVRNAVADSPNDQESSPILKLDVDGLEELFEWLSLADLRSLRQTCKRLKQVVDYFIKMNYPAVKIGYGRIILYEEKLNQIQHFDRASPEMIKQASAYFDVLTEIEIDRFKSILPQLERFQISTWQLNGDFYELILKLCSNLKYLTIGRIQNGRIIGENNGWLHHHYPSIECVAMDDNVVGGPGMAGEFPELKVLFELNPNIRAFCTTFNLLRANGNRLIRSNIEIDELKIYGDCFYENGMGEICELLNQLYERGFYKRLHMQAASITSQADLDRITSVSAMEKLSFKLFAFLSDIPLILRPMPHLRELGIIHSGDDIDLDAMAKNLINVERVYIGLTEVGKIIPFLRYAAKIKEIKLDAVKLNYVMDLPALNKERKGLIGANKVTIYVNEDIFLATKMTLMKTEFNMVTLKRNEATKWAHQLK